jgi:hypothetical protein
MVACGWDRRGVIIGRAHSGSNCFGIGIAELLENCQCVLPGDPGEPGIAEGLVGVAEGDEGSLRCKVTELTVQAGGVLVADVALFRWPNGGGRSPGCRRGLAELVAGLALQVRAC